MKRLLIIPVLLLLTLAANAQLFNIFGQEVGFIYVGPKVGCAFSRMTNADESFGGTVKSRTGFQFGIVGKFGFTDKFSIQPELSFYQKGVVADASGGFTSKYKTSYIGIPVLAKYALAQVGIVKIHIDGGVYTNVRTGGTYEFKSPTFSESGSLDNAGWRRMDYGFALGGGFEYPMEKGIWVFDLRYDHSVVDIHKEDGTFNANTTFGVSITYLFDFVDLYHKLTKKDKDTKEEEGNGSQNKPGLKVDRTKE